MIDLDLTLDEFRADYFEQKPRHFPGALKERPIAWSDLDQVLHTIDPREPAMRMFHHGQLLENVYVEEFSEAGQPRYRLNRAKFHEYMDNGATLQINWLERHLVTAKRLCQEIGRYAATATSGNAYMSFSGDGSFGEHWDTHDVFVIQLIGRKHWRIFPPTFKLPLALQKNDRSGHTCPTEPAIEMIVEEGDVIYLPRGWWHHVIPLQVGSFHLAVGCYAPTLFDYIVQTSAKFLELQLDARRAFSPTNYRDAVTKLMQQLPAVLLDPESAAAFELDTASRERMDAEFTLAALDSAAAPLSGDALLSLATFRSPALEDGMLLVNGAQLRLEPVNQAIVAALRDNTFLRFDALCTRLDDVPRDAVLHAVLELAHYDIITIQQ